MVDDAAAKPTRTRPVAADRKRAILEAAMVTFGMRGYLGGSLQDVAKQVGITHAGVLHHFGSKEQLLLDLLEYRDAVDVEPLPGGHIPEGAQLLPHLQTTAHRNASRPGAVQVFTVLSAEAVTEGHPAGEYFRSRYEHLRGVVRAALVDAGMDAADARVPAVAASILAVMDGLQVQWLLDPDAVDLGEATSVAIDAILAGVGVTVAAL
ncbi:TetR/AcrR family transcriptional regulator [Agrococcus jejuensis]|uniref:DNA-binding transcriptional regulator, AcrR family n=1 Tax=Agrococcus jejuensis TaxID=399736 RepID=A0A1G8C7J7_9MICO|nr:TetR/AcrR family transcriptional regulator [Agrococcus jejuensis]SDH41496.1 DNA-binding transcriptional regulator, AcrR family [Agrococcus jejuensis]